MSRRYDSGTCSWDKLSLDAKYFSPSDNYTDVRCAYERNEVRSALLVTSTSPPQVPMPAGSRLHVVKCLLQSASHP